ncbi:zinc-binding protein A33-like [Aulostomus maculatus]
MAWRSEEDFCCPACQDIYQDPVLLLCSHSFCSACLQSWWKDKQVHDCPICRTKSECSNPPRNLVLRNLCEAFLQERHQRGSLGPETLCSLHAEKLKLFCLDHQELACLVCRDAKSHIDHRFRPIEEAAQDHREELQKSLKTLRDKLAAFKRIHVNCVETATHIKVQERHIERLMKEKFEELHQFLEEEEEAMMAALKEEEQQKSQTMKEKIEGLCREVAVLSETIRATEEQLRADDVAFMRGFKAAVQRVQQLPDDPDLVPGALLDVAKHLGNLTFTVWKKMADVVTYSPVILDPNTANPELILSENLTSVKYGKRQQRPENPERFEYWDSVLGSGMSSGTHWWDVEVGDNRDWELGVLGESVCRQEFMGTTAWSIEYNGAGYRAYSPCEKYTDLAVREKLQRIRVHLDWDNGKLSFSQPHTNTLLHTFTHAFTEKLCPFLCTRKALPLKILPVKVSITVGSQR